MTSNTATSSYITSAEKFQNAEQLWFWFVYSKSVRGGFIHARGTSTKRVCELIDVETMITKLYLAGRLDDAQLAVMKEFGDRRRAPHQHIWAENKAADLWRRAMATIGAECYARGWVEDAGTEI